MINKKTNRGGLREPKGGRPKKQGNLKRVRCGDITLPKWLHSWLKAQDQPAGWIVERVLIEEYGLEEPKEG